MASWKRPPLAAVAALIVVLISASCGKKNTEGSSSTSPTGPTTTTTTTTTSGNTCRTYPTRADVHTTNSSSSVVFDAIEMGSFDTSTRKATVQTNFANGAPCSTNVVTYNSVADFVDEMRVIPPVSLAVNAVNTNAGACGSGTATTAYVYDSQRRVTQLTNGTSATTTYAAWDSSGRPTAGISGGATLSLVYNDGARTLTTTQNPPGGAQSVSTLSFDANGAQTKIVVVQGGVTNTTTFTNTATATVCK